MADKRDFYEVLGINKDASKEEIKRSYRKLAKEYHPDRNKAADAETKFKEVQEAYEVLIDDQKRKAYDQYGFAGTSGFEPGGGFQGFQGGFQDFSNFQGFDFGDLGDIGSIFDTFFGGGMRRSSRGGARSARGADLQLNIKLEFEEAIFGTEKTINYKRTVNCQACGGTGAKDGTAFDKCPQCGGQGRVTRVQQSFIGTIQTTGVCPNCNGNGKVIKEYCSKCEGKGMQNIQDEIKIKIPPGTPDGLVIRFKDRGNAGKNGGQSGDMYVQFEVKLHNIFERRGDDIYMEKDIDVVKAVLGGEEDVPTVHGDVTIKIPKGTQPGKILRLRGKGGPKLKGNGNGDQYIRLNIKIPQKISKDEQKVWKALEEIKQGKKGSFFDNLFK